MFPRRNILIAILCLANLCLLSQKGDSLVNLLNKADNDTNKVKLQLKISSLLQGSNVTGSLYYAEQAIELAKKLNSPRLLVKATNNAGHLYDYINFSEKAIIYHQAAIELCEKNHLTRELGDSYNWLGGVFYNKGNYDLAARNWITALKLRQQTGNKTGIAGSLNNIGEVYRLKGNADTALRYYRKAIAMNEVLNDKHFLSINYSNMGLVYQSQKKYEEAEAAYAKALDYAQQVNNTEQLALVNNSFGNYYLERGDYQQAYNYYTRGLNFASSCASMVERASSYKGLAFAGRGLKLSDEAFENFTRYQALNDTLTNLEKNRQVIDIGVRYETQKKEHELEQLKTEKSISELTEKHKQVLIYILLSGLLFLLIMAIALIYNNRSRRKLNTQLHDRLTEINKSINYAKKIQNTLLANENFMRQTLPDHFIFYRSKDIVSGDFYWASSVNTFQKAESHPGKSSQLFYLAVCDSTGHGVPGAFMSLLNIGFLSEAIKEKNIFDTGEVFNYVRGRLISVLGTEDQKDGFDGILLCFDRANRKITYSAAHNSPLLVHNNALVELPHDKMPVGIGERKEPFKTYNIDWIPGSTLYLFTDGYADQFGGPKTNSNRFGKGKKFKYNQLYNLLLANNSKDLDQQKDILEKAFDDWRGDLEQVDDVCVIGVRL